jgi:hypothetical protein
VAIRRRSPERALGTSGTINWGIFKRHFWGELLRHQQTSTPHYGELRWWFICPLARNDGGPPRRVAKRYLASGGKYFGSREGYGLTYTSCQESCSPPAGPT